MDEVASILTVFFALFLVTAITPVALLRLAIRRVHRHQRRRLIDRVAIMAVAAALSPSDGWSDTQFWRN